jgi:branched-chain amino acid transport system permease protein
VLRAGAFDRAHPFGLALQATRDNPRRLRALGYPVWLPRIAAFGIAGLIAGIGGVLNTWLNGSISPGSVAITPTIDVLIAAVLGGMTRPEGAYLGAFLFTVAQSFAIYAVPPERFNTVIGLIFIAVVVFSPDGVLGLGRAVMRRRRSPSYAGAPDGQPETRPSAPAGRPMKEGNHHA